MLNVSEFNPVNVEPEGFDIHSNRVALANHHVGIWSVYSVLVHSRYSNSRYCMHGSQTFHESSHLIVMIQWLTLGYR